MSRISIKFAELHNPLFMNGNLGTKLNPQGRTGLKLQYDTDLRALIVEYQSSACLVFSSNVASATVVNGADIGLEHIPVTNVLNPRAQVSAPIIQPTAPPARVAPMAPHVALPQRRSAQVSDPTRDVVDGTKLRAAPKFRPHSERELENAQKIQASGEIRAGKLAPTKADLIAEGKLDSNPVEPKVDGSSS